MISVLFLTFAIVSQLVQGQTCSNNHWPVFAGGFDGNEDVRCFVYDPTANLIIVGGVTNSTAWASVGSSGSTENAYMYAIDLDGNWQWGNYYTNDSNFQLIPLTSISSCRLSS